MNESKSFMKSTLAYFLGNILSKVIVFFMLPLYTTYISPANYGYYDLTVTYISFFSSILFLEIWSGTMRFMFDTKEYRGKLKAVYSSLYIYGLSLILYFITFSILNIFIKIQYFPLVLLYGVCLTLQNWYGNIARGFGKSMLFASSGVISTFVTVVLNIILIVRFKTPYWSLYVSSSMGILIQTVILEISVKLVPRFSIKLIDKDLTKQLFRYSLPLCLNSVAFWFLSSYNRVVIVNVLGESQNGYFAIASKFSVALNLIGTCFTLAWQETAYKKEGDKEGSGTFYSKASDLFIKFLLMGSICLLPVIGVMFKYMVNSNYNSAKVLIPLCILGSAISLYSSFLGNIFGAIKKTNTIFLSTFIASIVNVVVIYLAIGKIGVQAANLSFLLGFIVNCIIRVAILHREIEFSLSLKPFLLYIPLFIIVSFIFLTQNLIINVLTLLSVVIITLLSFKNIIITIMKGFELKHNNLV